MIRCLKCGKEASLATLKCLECNLNVKKCTCQPTERGKG